MSQISWLPRRLSARTFALVAVLMVSAFLLSACGLFGGDEETPQVVEPPPSATQQTQTSAASPATQEQQTQQQDRPSQAVAVTTSPSQDEQEQQTQPAAESVETEAEVDPTIYIVQPGDTLAAIANRLGVRIDDLITLNGIQDPDVLRVGQELKIPGAEQSDDAQQQSEPEQDEAPAEESDEEEEDQQIEPPSVELPTVAVPVATPLQVSYTQFPQPGPDKTTDTIPDAPSNFLQYGAAALPWLHGINDVEPIIELFKAWPMPALAVGNDRIILIDTNANGQFSASIVYTDPNSFGAAVPYSNLVVYDPVPGDPSKYRIAYDHAQAYAREVQGIQQLSDADMTGDNSRDLTFREITCDASGCVSSFYVLSSAGDGYRTITGSVAQVAEVSQLALEDRTGDGLSEIVVKGLALDEAAAAVYTFVFAIDGSNLVEILRVAEDGGTTDELEEEAGEDEDDDLLEE